MYFRGKYIFATIVIWTFCKHGLASPVNNEFSNSPNNQTQPVNNNDNSDINKLNKNIVLNITDTALPPNSSSNPLKSNESEERGREGEFQKNKTIKKALETQKEVAAISDKINNDNKTDILHTPLVDSTTENINATSSPDKESDSSGAKRRGFIVFGSLTVIAICYFTYKMYRKRRMNGETNSMYNAGDTLQFKYGMLLSNDGDNVEMLAADSMAMPGDSDDEDELEIFDLERRKQLLANDYRDVHTKDKLLAKDIDILDLELPGVRSSAVPQHLDENDLLDLDDEVDEILRKPTSQANAKDEKTDKNDDFFDIL